MKSQRVGTIVRHMSSSISSSPVSQNSCYLRVCLDRPSKLNALNLDMVREFIPSLAAFRNKVNACLLLEGTGEKAFCAGGDVASIREAAVKGDFHGLPADFFFEEYHLDFWLSQLRHEHGLTQVSVWDGVCMGGGVGLSIHGAIRVATERTLFAMPEVGIGLFPDVGATYALPRLSAGKEMGLYLALTGVRLGAYDCLVAGLATHYLPSHKLDELREKLSNLGSETNAAEISTIISQTRGQEEPAAPTKSTPLNQILHLIRERFSKPSVELILETLQSMADSDTRSAQDKEWATRTIKQIRQASPLSVVLTFEALKKNGDPSVSLKEAFKTEYRLTQRAVLPSPKADFCEGVRAVLVDRNQPSWAHKSIEQVSLEQDVMPFFSPLPKDHPRGEFFGDIEGELVKHYQQS